VDELQSRREVSEWLGLPKQTLANWASQGKGPRFYKVGRHTRYDPTDVRAWLEENAREPSGRS
jgi:excisionase family DNA binding protein